MSSSSLATSTTNKNKLNKNRNQMKQKPAERRLISLCLANESKKMAKKWKRIEKRKTRSNRMTAAMGMSKRQERVGSEGKRNQVNVCKSTEFSSFFLQPFELWLLRFLLIFYYYIKWAFCHCNIIAFNMRAWEQKMPRIVKEWNEISEDEHSWNYFFDDIWRMNTT